MRLFTSLAVVALATQSVVGDSWFSKPGHLAYNKWHETELERWLRDNKIPYPTPADRKDLENLVKSNWEDYVATPYNSWDVKQLTHYLHSKGHSIMRGTETSQEGLVAQVRAFWHETPDQASEAYSSVQNWVFDTWTESQLKAFLDYHGIPNPTPRTRDSLLFTARSNYQKVAEKAGETFSYPGDWLWQSWSDSDLKAWLDERGVPIPQPSSRDKLVAELRRNSRVASLQAADAVASASASASAASQSLSDESLKMWSDSKIKTWCDRNGIPVPQGSNRDELMALVRKHRAGITASASSAYGAATSNAGNFYAQVTNDVYAQARQYYDFALNQFGLAPADAQRSLSSASSIASAQAYESSRLASKTASSLSKQASKSAYSASSAASSAMSSAKAEL